MSKLLQNHTRLIIEKSILRPSTKRKILYISFIMPFFTTLYFGTIIQWKIEYQIKSFYK
jgi:hypothetical protein